MTQHRAHKIQFDALVENLEAAAAARLVYRRPGPLGLTMFSYSDRCVYDGAWDDTTLVARGLIVSLAEKRIVATPFPKFFNYGEHGATPPDLPFETTEKVDGSLIILFHHEGRWRTTTRGAFDSAQALWAQALVDRLNTGALRRGVTYLAEAIYPENRVVVAYSESTLRFLAAYDERGFELSYDEVAEAARALGLSAAARHAYSSLRELAEHTRDLPAEREGFVARFSDGHRLKFKGDAYTRLHALIFGVTPLNLWAMMEKGEDLEGVRRQLPEEFWTDFDAIRATLERRRDALLARIDKWVEAARGLSDKEVGLARDLGEPGAAAYIFTVRKKGGVFNDPRTRAKLLRDIRPDGNVLEGYTPTSAMKRLLEDLG